MKLRVSLPRDDVQFLHEYAKQRGLGSRSAALHKAVRLLRTTELAAPYAWAWTEWAFHDADAWDATAADGLEG